MIGKIKLLVAIEDEIYLDKLCDYLETIHGRFSTERFCSRQALRQALTSSQPFDALVFEADMLTAEQISKVRQIKVVLDEKDDLEPKDDCYLIRAYQKTETIANLILKICSLDQRFMGIDVTSADRARLFVFTSPVGGCGVTTVSLGAAMQLASSGKRTLYLSLERIPSLSIMIPADGITMTQIMRMVIENNPKLLTAIEGGKIVNETSGLEYFGGFFDPTDFDSLEPEHLRTLATRLCSLGRYDTVVIDLPWSVNMGTPLMEHADKIFLVSRNTNLSSTRINAFLQYASEKDLSYRNRLAVVVNDLSGNLNRGFLTAPVLVIPKYQMVIDTADFPAAALHSGSFSNALAELAHQF